MRTYTTHVLAAGQRAKDPIRNILAGGQNPKGPAEANVLRAGQLGQAPEGAAMPK